MNQAELYATVICEAKNIPAALIPAAAENTAKLMVRAAILAGERVEPLLKPVSAKEARETLQTIVPVVAQRLELPIDGDEGAPGVIG